MGVLDAAGMAIFLGLNSALYTFFAQAIGSQKDELAGEFRQKARLILIISFILLLPLYYYMGDLLAFCGQDPIISKRTGLFVI